MITVAMIVELSRPQFQFLPHPVVDRKRAKLSSRTKESIGYNKLNQANTHISDYPECWTTCYLVEWLESSQSSREIVEQVFLGCADTQISEIQYVSEIKKIE